MKTSKHSLYEAVLARISLGAVPIDGIYWFDPKATARADASKPGKARDAGCSPVSLSLGKSS
jgi:hypothetical protein